MALTTCVDCGGKVSTKAEACPHCGVPVPSSPPSKQKASQLKVKPKKKSSFGRKVLLALGTIFVFLILVGQLGDNGGKGTPRDGEDGPEVLADYYAENEDAVLEDLRQKIDQHKYSDAYGRGKPFLSVSDSDELRALVAEAEEKSLYQRVQAVPAANTKENVKLYGQLVALDPNNAEYKSKLAKYQAILEEEKALADQRAREEAEARRQARVQQLVQQLKSVPDTQVRKNAELYRELVRLEPDNSQYKAKLDSYAQRVKEQEAKEKEEEAKKKKERDARIAAFGEPPIQSGWDGSYSAVENYLEAIANDPDSIELDGCTKVYHTKDGWLVGCDYRGRNAFGGMIRQSNWFTIVYGRVVEMHDASAYSQ